MRKLFVLFLVTAVAGAFMTYGCAKKKTDSASKGSGLQRVHFDLDKSNIKAEYEPTMKSNTQWMMDNSKAKLVVEGHCDERGSVEYNIALGDRRAISAKTYMKNMGVDPNRVKTVSYGKERPLCTEHNEGCWWRNRRDEFVGEQYN
ncbi:MAG: peptidoglycan-associated lipoprotein [Deltaproteobacteria bacterium CG07_land_8_20_14_0_80_38_7]|nr:MAG: peptidoglycan-associated lipoprotein [Deltaproteobacteria bacterium CG07_land_8_20_14_0_80_38_7]